MSENEAARQEAAERRAATIQRLNMGATEQVAFKHQLDAIETAILERNALALHLAERDLERELDRSRGL